MRLPWPLLLAFEEDELLKDLLFGKKQDLEEGRAYLVKEKKPYWTTVIGLGDRSEVCRNDSFVDQVYPARVLAAIRDASCGPSPASNTQPSARPTL